MICVICNDNDSDNDYNYSWEKGTSENYDSVTCRWCRPTNYPDHMSDKQYKRYWDAYSIKWRREINNDMCHL